MSPPLRGPLAQWERSREGTRGVVPGRHACTGQRAPESLAFGTSPRGSPALRGAAAAPTACHPGRQCRAEDGSFPRGRRVPDALWGWQGAARACPYPPPPSTRPRCGRRSRFPAPARPAVLPRALGRGPFSVREGLPSSVLLPGPGYPLRSSRAPPASVGRPLRRTLRPTALCPTSPAHAV